MKFVLCVGILAVIIFCLGPADRIKTHLEQVLVKNFDIASLLFKQVYEILFFIFRT